MAQDTVKARIRLKNDTEANWDRAISFVPLKGEVIIYSADDAHPFSRIKVGDGITSVVNLPFVDANTLNGHAIYIDTTANFRANASFIPRKGDIVIFLDKDTIDNVPIPGIKVGDGAAYNLDLPFVGDEILQQLADHINDNTRHITQQERIFWNSKLNLSEDVEEETLILNRR